MNFSSINIQGNIISSEVLDKIRSEEKYKHQLSEAFGLTRNASLRDKVDIEQTIIVLNQKSNSKHSITSH